ncbi:secreted RxLR effector protein 161-like [Cicer arietinum]|uniref:secreted RxLR effector protein 161-like n=1 Tax=Cicer arietinum TaxID=3827 RepID=UPI003CC6553F
MGDRKSEVVVGDGDGGRRPHIVFAVGLCARFQSSPKESHLAAVKIIFRYLIDTTDLGLLYSKGSQFDFVAYCDVDYAGDKIERKNTSGACQFLGEALISWSCRKKNTIAISITKAKYVSALDCCSQVLWIKNQLEDFSVTATHATPAASFRFPPSQHSTDQSIKSHVWHSLHS